MITAFVRRVLPVVIVAVLLALLIRAQNRPDVGSDAWFHLRMGREFLDGWSIAHPGHLGRFDSADWAPTQWLAQLALVRSWDAGGITAVMWLAGFVILLLPTTIYVVARRTTAPLAAALATALCLMAAAPGLSARPQIVSYVLIVVVSGAWLTSAADGRVRWWLVPLTWIWVPIHGMWVIGVLIGAVVVAGMALERQFARRIVIRNALVVLACAAVAALTPIGVRVYATLYDVGSRTAALAEWDPPDLTAPAGLVLVLIMGVVLVSLLRQGPVPWSRLLFLGLAIGWALYTERTTVVAAVMLVPLLADAAQRFLPAPPALDRRELAALGVVLAVAAAVLWPVCKARSDVSVVPTWVDDRLAALPADSGVLGAWNLGPYLMWEHADLDLVMHGYVDVFTPAEIERNVDISSLQPGWNDKVADLDLDAALIERDSALGYALANSDGWRVVEQDDDYVFLTPR